MERERERKNKDAGDRIQMQPNQKQQNTIRNQKQNNKIQITEKKVIIKAGKKSATTVIKIYPKQMILKKQNVTLSCTPQWKEGGISKLTILLKRK